MAQFWTVELSILLIQNAHHRILDFFTVNLRNPLCTVDVFNLNEFIIIAVNDPFYFPQLTYGVIAWAFKDYRDGREALVGGNVLSKVGILGQIIDEVTLVVGWVIEQGYDFGDEKCADE